MLRLFIRHHRLIQRLPIHSLASAHSSAAPLLFLDFIFALAAYWLVRNPLIILAYLLVPDALAHGLQLGVRPEEKLLHLFRYFNKIVKLIIIQFYIAKIFTYAHISTN